MFPFISTISGAFIVIFEQIWQLFSGASIVDLELLNIWGVSYFLCDEVLPKTRVT